MLKSTKIEPQITFEVHTITLINRKPKQRQEFFIKQIGKNFEVFNEFGERPDDTVKKFILRTFLGAKLNIFFL